MKEFGLQIYSVRDRFTNVEDTRAALKELKEMGYSHIQTAGLYEYVAPEEFARMVTDSGLYVCGTHYDYDRIINDVSGTASYHAALGTKNIGIGGMPREMRTSERATLDFIESFNSAAKKYKKLGYEIIYEESRIVTVLKKP